MGKRIDDLKKAPNLVLAIIFFVAIAAAGFSYLYVKKPAIISTDNAYDVAVAGFLTCGCAALFFFLRSLSMSARPKKLEKEEAPKGCYLPDEPFGC